MKKTTSTINPHQQKKGGLLDLAGDVTLKKACRALGQEKGFKLIELFGKCKDGDKKAYAELETLYTQYASKQVEVIKSN